MNPTDWEELLLSATAEVWKAVSVLADKPGRGRKVGVGAAGDQTIYADKLAEDVLVKRLGKKGVRVLSEEAGSLGPKGGEVLAVVDPLDGSSNFERGIPFYCTSVAIVEGDSVDDVIVGVVRDLVSGDVYSARRGRGAKLNGKRIAGSGALDPKTSVVAVDVSRSMPAVASALVPLETGVSRVVHYGANALELCFLASGRIDAFVDIREKMRVTDLAGAALIAQEAGTKIVGLDGKKLELAFDLRSRYSLVGAATSGLLDSILKAVRAGAEIRPLPRRAGKPGGA